MTRLETLSRTGKLRRRLITLALARCSAEQGREGVALSFALSQSGSWWRIRDSFHEEADPRLEDLRQVRFPSDWLIESTWVLNAKLLYFPAEIQYLKRNFAYLSTVRCKSGFIW